MHSDRRFLVVAAAAVGVQTLALQFSVGSADRLCRERPVVVHVAKRKRNGHFAEMGVGTGKTACEAMYWRKNFERLE
jgi:hypothetical protein